MNVSEHFRQAHPMTESRPEYEQELIKGLEGQIEAFLKKGGKVKVLPDCSHSAHDKAKFHRYS